MKKVLILAYDFPPYVSIGSQRPLSWYNYFPEKGLFPVIITRHWDEDIGEPYYYLKSSKKQKVSIEESESGKIIRVPYKSSFRDKFVMKFGMHRFSLIRRMLSLIKSIFSFFSFSFDNTSNIYHEAERLMKKEKFDCILATGEPFILFRYADLLSRHHHVKWIADYRDCWSTDNSDFSNPFFNRLIFSLFFQRIERKIVKTASFITTAAPAYKDSLKTLFVEKDIHVIFNGYDNNTFSQLVPNGPDKDILKIAYAGTIYNNQDLEMFLEGFGSFIQAVPAASVLLIFYGLDFDERQKERLLAYNDMLNRYISTSSKMKYLEVLKKLQKAHILLLLSRKGWNKLAGKIFDYLALNRKILLVQNDHGILAAIMDECQGGIKCETAEDVKNYLSDFYHDFKENGEVQHQSCGYEKYSRKNQSDKLARLIHNY